jgi:hypothetical protein
VVGSEDLTLIVTYNHILPKINNKYTLKYAFGTGRVFVKNYENIELNVRLPSNTNIKSIRI